MSAQISEKWVGRLLGLAHHLAGWSKDPSTRVGAVVAWTPPEGGAPRAVGTGYNGFPRGVDDREERYGDRATKYSMIVHAEANAILTAVREVRGCCLFATLFPCTECSKLVIQAGVAAVYAPQPEGEVAERWKDQFVVSRTMLDEAGVQVHLLGGAASTVPPELAPAVVRRSTVVTMEDVAKAVGRHYKLAVEELRGRRKGPHLQQGRNLLAWICCRQLGRSTTDVGRYLDERHHTSIISAIKQVDVRLRAGSPNLVHNLTAVQERADLPRWTP